MVPKHTLYYDNSEVENPASQGNVISVYLQDPAGWNRLHARREWSFLHIEACQGRDTDTSGVKTFYDKDR